MLARTLRNALGGSGAPSLKQQTLVKVDEALREFERERTRRKLKISVKSNLMGAALQIPFAPVSEPKAWCCVYYLLLCKKTTGCDVAQLLVLITPTALAQKLTASLSQYLLFSI